jgi:hypothetical protein
MTLDALIADLRSARVRAAEIRLYHAAAVKANARERYRRLPAWGIRANLG